MHLNRRAFFGLAAAACALELSSSTIFLPPRGGWIARDLGQLWFDYCAPLLPPGVALAFRVGGKPSHEFIRDFGAREWWVTDPHPGLLTLHIDDDIAPSSVRRMREALLKPTPGQAMMITTLPDLLPWA